MKFSLIVCTYMRPKAIVTLLNSVKEQTLYPDEIIVVDGSINKDTQDLLLSKTFKNLTYFLIEEKFRGLTKQRNFGISKVATNSEIVCFLDDDTILKSNYFEELIKTFVNKQIIGVGGISINENRWKLKKEYQAYPKKNYYELDGYIIKESLRNIIRNYLGLQSDKLPGVMPDFSNGRTYSYPLNGKTYEVDLLIGMSFSFRKKYLIKLISQHTLRVMDCMKMQILV
ncbi:glycosyltransferase family 2 protein [Tenacibaculum aquimarinum]|uniref:glycosyltransferase family 2 protein n=1 Tax=Tenacibaculum aquimarinum TaxID=2910675 RepID=UPI0028682DFC|nr:glycosyltransferase family 2 protein [Tenacibaculum aquimarinum]